MSTNQHVDHIGSAIVSDAEKQIGMQAQGQGLYGQLLTLTQSLNHQHDTVFSVDAKALAAVSQILRLPFEPNRNWLTSHEFSKIINTALDSGQLEGISNPARDALLKAASYLSVLNHVKDGQIGFDKHCLPNKSKTLDPSVQGAATTMGIQGLKGVDTLSSTDKAACETLTEGIATYVNNTLKNIQPADNNKNAPAPAPAPAPVSNKRAAPENAVDPTNTNKRKTSVETQATSTPKTSKPVNLNHEQSAIVYNKKMEILNALAYNGIINIDFKSDHDMVDMKKTFENLPKDSSAFFVMTLFFMEGVDRDAEKDGTDKANGYLNISECLYRIAGETGSPQELAPKAQAARPIDAVKIIDKALQKATKDHGEKAGTELVIRAIRAGSSGVDMHQGTELCKPGENINAKLAKLHTADAYDSNRYVEVFKTFQHTIMEHPSYMYDDTRLWENVSYQG